MIIRRSVYPLLISILISVLPHMAHAQGYRGGRGDLDAASRQERPHGQRMPAEFMNRILEDAGCPLTDTQKSAIDDIERGPGFREKVFEILTEEQKSALEAAREEKGENRGEGRGMRRGGGPVRMMAAVLEDAECPLSETQLSEIRAVEPGPDARAKIGSVLTDEQKKALEAHRESMGDRPERGMRSGMRGPGFAGILDAAGYPLSDSQIDALKAVERGPGAHEQVFAILDDNQKSALEQAEEARRAEHLERLTARLEQAGVPLTAEQKSALEAIEPGPELRGALHDILTEEQADALRPEGPGPKGSHPVIHGRRMSAVLDDAGCPLSDEQREAIRALPRGPEHRDAVAGILTGEQLSALEAARSSNDTMETGGAEKTTAVEGEPEAISILKPNYPNPFNPVTTIDYSLAKAGNVRIEAYSPGGQLVATLANEYQAAGTHSVVWDASGRAAGVYLVKLISGASTVTQKMTLMK